MKEVIILEIKEPSKSHLVQNFLKSKKIDYQVLVEEQTKPKKTDIFANYDQAVKNKGRDQELKLWDNADLDEQLNTDGEWWS